MTLQGEYVPSKATWVREQVEEFEASNGERANILRGHPEWPIVVITSKGAKSGKLRKNPVMRVEHDGVYAAVASKGGAPEHPTWYHNFVEHPEGDLQDGSEKHTYRVRVAEGAERMRDLLQDLLAYTRASALRDDRGLGAVRLVALSAAGGKGEQSASKHSRSKRGGSPTMPARDAGCQGKHVDTG